MGALRDDRDANAILAESGEEALRAMLDGAIKTPGKKKPKESTPEEKLKTVDKLLRTAIECADEDYAAAKALYALGRIDAARLEEKRKASGRAWGFEYADDPKPSEDPGKTYETPPNEESARGSARRQPPPATVNSDKDAVAELPDGYRYNDGTIEYSVEDKDGTEWRFPVFCGRISRRDTQSGRQGLGVGPAHKNAGCKVE